MRAEFNIGRNLMVVIVFDLLKNGIGVSWHIRRRLQIITIELFFLEITYTHHVPFRLK